MGDRTNKNKKLGPKNDVQIIVGVVNASGMKQAGSGNTRKNSTVKMGVTQTSRQGNTQTASKVFMKTTTGQTHTGPQNRPQQNNQQRVTNQNHHQNRPPQNKVTKMVPSASSQQISVTINLATINQTQHCNNQQRNNQQRNNQQRNNQHCNNQQRYNQQNSNQQHKGNQQQGRNNGQSAAQGQHNKHSQGMKPGVPVDTVLQTIYKSFF